MNGALASKQPPHATASNWGTWRDSGDHAGLATLVKADG